MDYRKKLATPYRKDPRSLSARRKVAAYDALLGLIPAPIMTYKDYFAGIGLGAEIVRKRFAPKMVLQDIDAGCLGILAEKFPGEAILKQDFFTDVDETIYDLTALDFNVFTVTQLAKSNELRERTVRATSFSRWTILTDSARSKFHLNRASYHVDTLGEYFELLADELELELVEYQDKVEVAYALLLNEKGPGNS